MTWIKILPESLIQDVRFGARQLCKRPGFTAAAVLTLALGIGPNAAVFSIIHGLLLKPLPYRDAERLVTLWERNPWRGIQQERVTGPNYLDWRRRNTVLSEMAVSAGWEGSDTFNLVLRDRTVKVHASYASASLFTTLGTRPLLGRAFLPEEDQRGGNRVAVLGYGLWQRHFRGASNVIGQSLVVDTYGRREYTIVGVMPPQFGVPSQSEMWLPIGWMGVTLTERRSAHWFNVIARLKPGVTLEKARAELTGIQRQIQQAYPGEAIGSEVDVVPLLEQALGRKLRTGLLVLWGAVAGVLLIACANVANLMLARAATRQKEFALRRALGAGRWRLGRQLLVESVLLAGLSGACGALLGWMGIRVFVATAPGNIPRLAELSLDPVALAFTAGISVLTGLVFGLAPAWQFARTDLNQSLKEGMPGAFSGGAGRQMRHALIVAEVSVSVVLLAAAGLMLQSFGRILNAERGFRPEHLLTAELDFSVSGFTTWVRPTETRPQVALNALMERVRTLPGVQAVGAGSRLLRRDNQPPHESLFVFGRPSLTPEEQPKAEFKGVTPDWFRALGGRILRGRDFTEADTLQSPGVVLVNETLARRYFPNEDPIGEHIAMGSGALPLGAMDVWGLPVWSTIIGIVADIKSLHPQPEAVPEVYVSHWHWPMQNPTLLIRTVGSPASLSEIIRRETARVIPNLPVPLIREMDDLLSETVAQPRLQTALLSLFAGLALSLSAVGLGGVLAYAVAQRRHEIGIRMALGAAKKNVVRLVITEGMKLVLIGAVVGVGVALALTRLLRTLLYDVQSTDPVTFVGVMMLTSLVALLACWIPAQRAAQVDPIIALRTE